MQVDKVVEGLDFAFPDSRKIGGVLSTATRPRARALFAWSEEKDGQSARERSSGRRAASSRERRSGARAEGRGGRGGGGQSSSETKTGASTRKAVAGSREQGQGSEAGAATAGSPASAPTSSSKAASSNGGDREAPAPPSTGGGNIFGNFIRMFTGGRKDSAEAESKQPPRGGGFGPVPSGSSPASSSPSSATPAVGAEVSGSGSSSGMYLHGAVVLAIHGDVVMDTVTAMVSVRGRGSRQEQCVCL